MEKKISKGIVAGCLAIVLALTIWVININDTYSIYVDESVDCQQVYKGYESYFECSKDGKTYNVPVYFCYVCTGEGERDSNYRFTVFNNIYGNGECVNGEWEKVFESDPSFTWNENQCHNISNDKYITFNVNNNNSKGGKLYYNGLANANSIYKFSMYRVDISKYTAEYSDNSGKIYTFTGWDTTNSCTSPKKEGVINPTEDMNLYACYSVESTEEEVKTFNVTLSASSKNNIDGIIYENDTSKNVKEYTINDIKENTDFDLSKYSGKIEGYTFKGWSPMQLCLTTVSNYKITKDSKFYACYDKDTESKDEKIYKITFDPNGGTWSDGIKTKKNKEYSSKKNLKDSDIVITRKGYKFAGWKDNNGKVFIDYIDYSNNGSYLTAVWEEDSDFVNDPDSNPNTGNSLIYIFIFFGLLTLVYLVSNVKKNKIG